MGQERSAILQLQVALVEQGLDATGAVFDDGLGLLKMTRARQRRRRAAADKENRHTGGATPKGGARRLGEGTHLPSSAEGVAPPVCFDEGFDGVSPRCPASIQAQSSVRGAHVGFGDGARVPTLAGPSHDPCIRAKLVVPVRQRVADQASALGERSDTESLLQASSPTR